MNTNFVGWKPKSFYHELDGKSRSVPIEDLKGASFETWSSQSALISFIQKLMKDSLPTKEQI